MASIPNTYNGLLAAVQESAEDDSQEFVAYIPTAIFLAEERLIREIDTEGVSSVVDVQGAANDPTITKPETFVVGHDVGYSVGNVHKFVTKKMRSWLLDYWPNATVLGAPKYYGEESDTKIRVAPTPDAPYVFHFSIVGKPPHLSANVQSNYFSAKCADALFFATMSHMMSYSKNSADKASWEKDYETAISTLNNQGRRERRDDAPADSPKSGRNTLQGTGN